MDCWKARFNAICWALTAGLFASQTPLWWIIVPCAAITVVLQAFLIFAPNPTRGE